MSTTPKAKSFVGLAEVLMNDRDTSREEDESEEAKARSQAEVMDLITKISEDHCLVMTAEIEEMVKTLREKVGIGIWDTGCRKTVAGATWIKTYVQALSGMGYAAEFAACTEKFKFGNQGTLKCTRCWYLPVMMYGRMGTLAVHEVAGDCPLLISEESMAKLGVVLRLRAKKIDIEDLEISGEDLEFHPRSGHPIVRLLPTTRNDMAGAVVEEQFVGEITIDMPDLCDESGSELDEVHFVQLKKGVRRRFAGLTSAATSAATKAKQNIRRRPKILEVFTWTMAISLAAATRQWDVLEPVTLESGWDLRLPKHRAEALEYVARERPDVIVAAWPCTAFSPLQNLMKNHEGYQAKLDLKLKEALPLLEFSARLAEIQLNAGRHFLGENPLTSKAWKTAPGLRMQKMLFSTRTHLRAHG